MNRVQSGTGAQESNSLEGLYNETVRFIDMAMRMEPDELQQELEQAEKKVVRLRDCIIEQFRKDSGSPQSRWRKPLDQVNVALSLIAAVEYPATGIHRSYMEHAQKVLNELERDLIPIFSE